MNVRDEVIQILKGSLSIEVDFTGWSWASHNLLEVRLMLDGEEIATTSTYVEWYDSSKDEF